MPNDYPKDLGGLGMFNAIDRGLFDESTPPFRLALFRWVASMRDAEVYELTHQEEFIGLYTSTWLRASIEQDLDLGDEWIAFVSKVPKHKYQAIAFVSWFLRQNRDGERSTILKCITGVQWNHPEKETLLLVTDSELIMICQDLTVAVPRFGLTSASLKKGFTNGRIVFSDNPDDRQAFGIDQVLNEEVEQMYSVINPRSNDVAEGTLEQIALRDLGSDWIQWRPALDALSSGLGELEYRLDIVDSPLLIPAEIGVGRWQTSREEFVRVLEEVNLQVFLDFAHVSVPEEFGGNAADSEFGPDRVVDVLEAGLPVPLFQAWPDLWRNPEKRGPLGGLDPWDVLADRRNVLIAVSNKGIWRVPQDGSALYFNPWSNIVSAEVFSQKKSISPERIDVLLFTGPQNPFQLGLWSHESRVALKNLFEPDHDFNPLVIAAAPRADWLKLNKDHAKTLSLKLGEAFCNVPHPSESELVERVLMHTDLENLGMEWAILPLFEEDSWVVRDFDCPTCGRLAATSEAILLRRSQLDELQKELGDSAAVYNLASWYHLQTEASVRVKPAHLQREAGLSYDESLRVITTFEALDFSGPTRCNQCVERQIRKVTSGGTSERVGLPPSLRFQILQASGFRCVYCGRGSNSTPPVELEVDHIVPVAAGGSNEPGNLQASCRDCNRGKSAGNVV
jgi:5-methylcytosine-specific restriction endonuclease McrA